MRQASWISMLLLPWLITGTAKESPAVRGPQTAAPLTFGTPVVVQSFGSGAGEPTLQVAPDDTLWLTDLFQIRKSTDAGATWSAVPPPLSRGGSDMDATQGLDGHVHAVDLDQKTTCILYYRSSDGGATFESIRSTVGDGVWHSSDGACAASSPHPLVDRPWVAAWGAETVYIVYRAYSNSFPTAVDVSKDGGETFTHSVIGSFPEATSIAVDPVDGSLYVVGEMKGSYDAALGRNTGRGIVVAASKDGTTFSSTTVISSDQFDLQESEFPTLAVDSGHNVYVTWSDNSAGTIDVYVSASRDRGATWSAPIRVSHDLTLSVYPTIAAGDAGRIAVAWYGTADPARSRGDAHGANWNVYVAMSTNILDSEPSFAPVKVTDQPFHHNSMCAHLNVCEGLSQTDPPGYERGILDFFRMTVDRAGLLNLVWSDTTGAYPVDHFARQTAGPLLKLQVPRRRAVSP